MSVDRFPKDAPTVVTCGLPYANGDIHIGHLRSLVSADVLNRALNRIGQESIYVCGSDMHGTPVAVNAAQEGLEPDEFAMQWHERFQELFPSFNIDFDNYGHTHDETNTATTLSIIEELIEGDHIYEREIEVAFDPIEEQPLPDRYVEGTCPYCGEPARGDECDEGCGRHLEPGEIDDPVSSITGNPAEYQTRTHKFFRVSAFEDVLSDFLEHLEGTANARNQPQQWIKEGLQDWCITRDMDWGIPYPGEEELVLYVWVDAPIEYISSTKQYSQRVGKDTFDWEDPWRRDGDIIHVIGRDIIQHHTIFWPAMLHACNYTLPRAVCAHGFITIAGKGLSTSRNRAIWAHEYLDEGFKPDLLRFYLTATGGLQQDIDFSWVKFGERVNGELIGTLGNFVYRSLLFAHRHFDGTPDRDVSPEVRNEIEAAIADMETAVNEYDIRTISQLAISLARFGNEYIQRHEPWHLLDDDPERAAQVLRDCIQLTKAIAVIGQPTLPSSMQMIWTQLDEPEPLEATTVEHCLAAPPESFDAPTELFEPIEDDRLETLSAGLDDKLDISDEESDEDENEETAPRIDFDTFQSVDLRIGTIVEAEPIDDADELLRLVVDIGSEERQVVAGLKQFYELDELPGTTVVVVANLEPTTLFGVESNGMVLAAGEEANLLTTVDPATPGEEIR